MLAAILLILFFPLPATTGPLLTGTSEGMGYRVEKVVENLDIPWGMTFLGPAELLFTEKNGRISIYETTTGKVKTLLAEVSVYSRGQGGLLDVAVPPGYQTGDWIYFTYSKPRGKKAATALARAHRLGDQLTDWQDLLITRSESDQDHHFGSRIAFDGRGQLFFSVGDRGDRQGSGCFAGALVTRHLNRVVVGDNGDPIKEERLLLELEERIRALAESPEGWLYFSTDSGAIYRLRPAAGN